MEAALEAFLLGVSGAVLHRQPDQRRVHLPHRHAEPPTGRSCPAGAAGGGLFAGCDDGVAVGWLVCAGVLRHHPGSAAGRRRTGGRAECMGLLNRTGTTRSAKGAGRLSRGDADDIALFPLTIPFTTGPGTISVAVTLGASHPQAVRRARLVLPRHERRGHGDGRRRSGSRIVSRSA